MDEILEFVSTNAVVSALLVAAILGLVGWILKAWRDGKDSQKIYDFLVSSQSETDYTFRSTEKIASHTKLTEDRVETLCSRHPKIGRNEKEKQSWTLVT